MRAVAMSREKPLKKKEKKKEEAEAESEKGERDRVEGDVSKNWE